ncbi:DUF4019 domain-containing protein [Aquimarina sp. I32.4]|uniref:DUF4019 domain-containing protein n=1 Tax=Aquimarina sp. I32.4 TaxID=2053903 RepID=UPI001E5769BF|nr:DUF4019 domain-containing protein [Aquimarina sp. I32.4]
MLLVLVACSQTQLSHTDAAKVVVESFHNKDNTKLKAHTTADNYASLLSIQNTLVKGDPKKKASNFKLLNETVEGDIAWVQFTTSYEEKPQSFKLTKADGQWRVMQKGVREKGPF